MIEIDDHHLTTTVGKVIQKESLGDASLVVGSLRRGYWCETVCLFLLSYVQCPHSLFNNTIFTFLAFLLILLLILAFLFVCIVLGCCLARVSEHKTTDVPYEENTWLTTLH